jgi:hypothetical protein
VAGDLNSPAPQPPSVVLAGYVADVDDRIPGWRRGRRSALRELADGLDDAAAHYRGLGLDPAAAAARAVQDCGPPAVVAAEFTTMLATRQARCTALALLLTGPLIGVLWLATLTPEQAPDALLRRVPVLGFLILSAVAAGLLTLAATGPASRWLPDMVCSPCRATAAACALAAVADVVVLTYATWSTLEQPSATRWLPGLIAAGASLLRFGLTQRIALRDLRQQVSV